jgi:hypothetical protein
LVAQLSNPEVGKRAIIRLEWLMTIFTLYYRRGSIGQSEVFSSYSNAITSAYAMINLEGHHSFSIEAGSVVVMSHAEIEKYYHAAKAALMRGRKPARALSG